MSTEMKWLHCEGDEPLFVRIDHKNRIMGKPFHPETIEKLSTISLRPDDVFICSYPKSGCHWVWENVRILLEGDINFKSVDKESMFIEFYEHNHFADHPSPRIFNTHTYFDDQPADLSKGIPKVILVYRNPKDICVSFYHHHSRIPSYKYNGKFSNYIHRFLQGKVSSGKCFEYWKMWEEGLRDNPDIQFLLVRYEDLHQNPISERRRIAQFLGKTYDDDFLQKVVDASDIDMMKKTKDAVTLKDRLGEHIVYRKGKVGDWQNHFTAAESEMFDKVVGKEMADSKLFEFVYSID